MSSITDFVHGFSEIFRDSRKSEKTGWRRRLAPSLPSRNRFLAVVKNYVKSDTKVFCSFLIFLIIFQKFKITKYLFLKAMQYIIFCFCVCYYLYWRTCFTFGVHYTHALTPTHTFYDRNPFAIKFLVLINLFNFIYSLTYLYFICSDEQITLYSQKIVNTFQVYGFLWDGATW